MKLSVSLVALLGVADAGFYPDIFSANKQTNEVQFFAPQGAKAPLPSEPIALGLDFQSSKQSTSFSAAPQQMASQMKDDQMIFFKDNVEEIPHTLEQVMDNLNGVDTLVTTQAGTVTTVNPDLCSAVDHIGADSMIDNNSITSATQILTCDNAQATLTTQCMTRPDYDGITSEIQTEFNGMDANGQSDFAGCILRLAGHDFMDFVPAVARGLPVSQQGGSDGCLDLNDGDNRGLCCMQKLSTAYNDANIFNNAKVCERVSLADFIVIAGEAVMEKTKVGSSAIGFAGQFKFGRTTNEQCAWAHGRLPNPENSCIDGDGQFDANGKETGLPFGGSSVKTNFLDSLGLTWPEAATLMGVHTLGRVDSMNSGYNGWWSEPAEQGIFNNNYFQSLIGKGWSKKSRGTNGAQKTQWEWVGKGNTLMLNNQENEPVLMLNSDLCLWQNDAPSGGRLDLCADNQCAWNHMNGNGMAGAVTNTHCGDTRLQGTFVPFGTEHNLCCNDDTSPNPGVGCLAPGSPLGADGLSSGGINDHIRNLASDFPVAGFSNGNEFFYSEFLKVWEKATTNGFEPPTAPSSQLTALHAAGHQCVVNPPSPTKNPTFNPTLATPTKFPTNSPTKFPTKKGTPPTFPPTSFPTPAPTLSPGEDPTCWTPWFNRDTPSGTGEWETLMAHSKEHRQEFINAGCSFDVYSNSVGLPKGVECASYASGSQILPDDFTNGIKCTPEEGLVCLNSDQQYGTCDNYKIRFNCCESSEDAANGKKTTLTFQGENKKQCKMMMVDGKIVSSCPMVAPGDVDSNNVASLNSRVDQLEQDMNQRMSAIERKL